MQGILFPQIRNKSSVEFNNTGKTILSLYDYTGQWSQPYREAGYNVVQVDLKHGVDVLTWDYRQVSNVHGILAAQPCTHFTKAGSRFWALKDANGTTAAAVKLVHRTLEIIRYHNPKFWVLENPPGRIASLCPDLGKRVMSFEPYHFGDGYKKLTNLWGRFSPALFRTPVVPVAPEGNNPSMDVYYGITKLRFADRAPYRDMTPKGFARAFFTANP